MSSVLGVAGLKMKLSERSPKHGMRVTENTMHRTAAWQVFRELLG